MQQAARGTDLNNAYLSPMPPMSTYRHTPDRRFPVLASNEARVRAQDGQSFPAADRRAPTSGYHWRPNPETLSDRLEEAALRDDCR